MQLSVSVERTGVMAPRIMEFDKAIGVNSSTIVPNCPVIYLGHMKKSSSESSNLRIISRSCKFSVNREIAVLLVC